MTSTPGKTFQIWSGTRRWDGDPEIRAAKKGRGEWGAGIYGSTHFETCQSYAKGGGRVQLLTIQQARTIEKSCIPLATALEFIKKSIPKNQQSSFIEDCISIAERVQNRIVNDSDPVGELQEGGLWFPAESLRNLVINADLCFGARSVALTNFLAEQGIGLSIDKGGMKAGEAWSVVYDPRLIVSWEPHTYESALEVGHVLPKPDAHTTEVVQYLRNKRRTYSSSLDY